MNSTTLERIRDEELLNTQEEDLTEYDEELEEKSREVEETEDVSRLIEHFHDIN